LVLKKKKYERRKGSKPTLTQNGKKLPKIKKERALDRESKADRDRYQMGRQGCQVQVSLDNEFSTPAENTCTNKLKSKIQ